MLYFSVVVRGFYMKGLTYILKIQCLFQEQRQATKENVQRKQARTVGEREESDNDASESDSDDEDDNDVIYNPKNLPLGWDGKVSVLYSFM